MLVPRHWPAALSLTVSLLPLPLPAAVLGQPLLTVTFVLQTAELRAWPEQQPDRFGSAAWAEAAAPYTLVTCPPALW